MRSSQGIYATRVAEGILRQTIEVPSGTDPVVACFDKSRDIHYFAVVSEKFPTRAYIVRQLPDGSWYFSGDARLKDRYIQNVQAFLFEQAAA